MPSTPPASRPPLLPPSMRNGDTRPRSPTPFDPSAETARSFHASSASPTISSPIRSSKLPSDHERLPPLHFEDDGLDIRDRSVREEILDIHRRVGMLVARMDKSSLPNIGRLDDLLNRLTSDSRTSLPFNLSALQSEIKEIMSRQHIIENQLSENTSLIHGIHTQVSSFSTVIVALSKAIVTLAELPPATSIGGGGHTTWSSDDRHLWRPTSSSAATRRHPPTSPSPSHPSPYSKLSSAFVKLGPIKWSSALSSDIVTVLNVKFGGLDSESRAAVPEYKRAIPGPGSHFCTLEFVDVESAERFIHCWGHKNTEDALLKIVTARSVTPPPHRRP